MLATAGLGFALKGNIDKLQSKLTSTKGLVQGAEAAAKNAKADAEKAKDAAKTAEDKATKAEETAATKTKEADDANSKLKEKDVVIESKDKEIATLKANPTANPDAANMAQQLQQAQAQLAEATTAKQNAEMQRDEAKVALDAKVAEGKANEEKVTELQKERRRWEGQFQKPGVTGRILAVNSGWNFVVLSVGDKQGVVANATLLVVRGNEPIARLRVTSVEPSTSIADVLPGTVRKGTAVQPGDTVIFEGTRGQAPQVPKSSSEPPASQPLTPTTPALPNS
jgi:hypothetical protein